VPIIALECADLSAAVDPDLGCGLIGLWRRVGGLRVPIVPAAPVPDPSPAELLACWPHVGVERCAPIAIEHRTPLSIAWRWPDGATARWELAPDALHSAWTGADGLDAAPLERAGLPVDRVGAARAVIRLI